MEQPNIKTFEIIYTELDSKITKTTTIQGLSLEEASSKFLKHNPNLNIVKEEYVQNVKITYEV